MKMTPWIIFGAVLAVLGALVLFPMAVIACLRSLGIEIEFGVSELIAIDFLYASTYMLLSVAYDNTPTMKKAVCRIEARIASIQKTAEDEKNRLTRMN